VVFFLDPRAIRYYYWLLDSLIFLQARGLHKTTKDHRRIEMDWFGLVRLVARMRERKNAQSDRTRSRACSASPVCVSPWWFVYFILFYFLFFFSMPVSFSFFFLFNACFFFFLLLLENVLCFF
jgi:hypothetical protein